MMRFPRRTVPVALRLAAASAFVAVLLCLAPSAAAATKTWIGGTGQWDVSANWSPSGQPQAGNDVYLTQSDATDRTVTYYNTTNPDAILNSLRIDATGTGTMTLNMPNTHSLSVTTEYVGYSGKGAVTQSAGTNNAEAFYVGYAGGNGTYTMTGGQLCSGSQYVGYSGGIGTLNIQNGGQVSNTNGHVGYDFFFGSGSSGTVTVDGSGSKWTNSGYLYVGYAGGIGTLNIQNGGQVSNTSAYLGRDVLGGGSSGTVTVDGSGSKWINSGYLYVGYAGGIGTLNIQNGGEVSNANAYLGFYGDSSSTATVNGSGSKWTTSGTLYLGRDGAGTVDIQNGGQVSNTTAYLGYVFGSSNGTVTVDGSGSLWNNTGSLYVGGSDTAAGGRGSVAVLNSSQLIVGGTLNLWNNGSLTIQSGGSISADSLDNSAGGTLNWINGTLGITGTGGLTLGTSGPLGASLTLDAGKTLNVTNTATITSGATLILAGGSFSAGNLSIFGSFNWTSGAFNWTGGTVTVDGSGSNWTKSGDLYVGSDGTSTLNIQNGGQVTNDDGYLGYKAGSSGTVTVDGIGSKWTNSGYSALYVGGAGTLNIRNGGQVSNAYGYLSGTATVDGIGSKWTNSGDLYVGCFGTGVLKIQNGGEVSNTSGHVGYDDGFPVPVRSGTVTVDGVGSKWTNSGDLYVGHSAGTGSLNIQNGGQVFNNRGDVGGFNSTVTVTGSGSKWTNSADLDVGYSGTGTVNIQNGGEVSNTNAYLGFYGGSNGTATVEGIGSYWSNSGNLFVGFSGTGTLNIRNGGQVSNAYGYLSGTATVDGMGSWTSSGYLLVGFSGTGTLNIQNGGQVSDTDGFVVGTNGTVTVDGVGSRWINSGVLEVGSTGTGTLNIQNGGQVFNTNGFVSGSNSTVTVDGGGSKWTNSGNPWSSGGYLYVGYSGTGTLNIKNGGEVSSTCEGYLGYNSGSSGTVSVDGSGSKWTNSGELYVGFSGTGTLNIKNGGEVVSNGYGYLGAASGSNGTVTVDGIGSKWTISGYSEYYLYVGYRGTGTLNIKNGGEVSTFEGYLGYNSGSNGTVTVDGIGSKWTNSWDLYVGYLGTGTLIIQNGGQVSNTADYYGVSFIGIDSGSSGRATVDGIGSKWTNSAELYVGCFGGTGTLNIQNGGQVCNTNGCLGYNSDSNGTATVDGNGSLWNNTGSLYVGGWEDNAGGAGSVKVKNGGQLAVGGTLKMWNDDSAVTVSAATLTAGALAGSAGTIRITDPEGGTALTVGSDVSDTFSGAIRDDTGPGSLTKVGGGTQTLGGANTYSGGTKVQEGTLLVENTTGSGTGTGPVTVGAATLGGTGFINGPVTLTGDATLTSTGTLTINNTLTVQGLANQLASGTVLTSGDVTIEPEAVFIINGTLGGGTGDLIVRGTLMGKGTINKSCVIEAGGVLSPGAPSTIEGMAQMVVGGGPQTLAFEIGAAGPNYASPSNSVNDLVRLTDAVAPFADATGGAAVFGADTVIDVYFLSNDPAMGGYRAEFFAATDFTDAIVDATYEYWRLDPHGSRYHNGNLYSPLDESLVDWSVVPEMAVFDGLAASGYITEFTVVPEPATLALVAMGVAAMLRRRRR